MRRPGRFPALRALFRPGLLLSVAIAIAIAIAGAAPTRAGAGAATANPPSRVVSMNVCTDQLAMMIAAPGQLKSVSFIGAEEQTSVMAEQARAYPLNHGLAEEIFLLQPDLILAGSYTTRSTVLLLRKLGFRVEEFKQDASFADVRDNILRMGDLLGRRGRAIELVSLLERRLAGIEAVPVSAHTVAVFSPNSYTAGKGTLADAVIEAAGLSNIAAERGLWGPARLPLELLIDAAPDMLIAGGDRYGGTALAQAIFRHPAFRALASRTRMVSLPGPYWVCGGPFTAEAVRLLREAASKPVLEQ